MVTPFFITLVGFFFSEDEPTALVQNNGGPCSVIASVQVEKSYFDKGGVIQYGVTMVKIKDQACCLKDGTDGVVSTASATTSNPLPTLYCYDISGSNDRGG